MGPSGAGKSSFLGAITGKVSEPRAVLPAGAEGGSEIAVALCAPCAHSVLLWVVGVLVCLRSEPYLLQLVPGLQASAYGIIGGDLFINGKLRGLKSFDTECGFVPQDDTMHRDLRVREVLQ